MHNRQLNKVLASFLLSICFQGMNKWPVVYKGVPFYIAIFSVSKG